MALEIDPSITSWNAMIAVAKAKGYDFLVKAMEHAKNGNGDDLTFYNGSTESQELLKIQQIQNIINEWISIYKETNQRSFSTEGELTTSDSPEFYYVIQHYTLYGSVEDNGNMLIRLTDTYNFDSFRAGVSVGAIGNNLGLINQYAGNITTYDINIYAYVWAGNYTGGSSSSSDGNTSTGAEYEVKRYSEYGTCYPETTINFRSSPNAENSSNIVGQYYIGESVNYDLVVLTNKYAYISWVGASSGTRRYMAVRDVNTGERWAKIV